MPSDQEGLCISLFDGLTGFTPKTIAILAALCAIATSLVVVGSVVRFQGKTSYPGISVLFLYFLMVIPGILFIRASRQMNSVSLLSNSQYHVGLLTHLGFFLVGVIAISGPWLTFILYRTQQITITAIIFLACGGGLFIMAFLFMRLLQRRESSNEPILY